MKEEKQRPPREEIADLKEQIANLQERLDYLVAQEARREDVMHYAEADPRFRQWRARRARER